MNSRYKIIECKRGERVSGYPSNLNQLKNYTGLTQLATKFDWSFTPGQIHIRLPGGLIWRAQLKLGNASNQRTVEYCLESNDRICNFGPWPIYIYRRYKQNTENFGRQEGSKIRGCGIFHSRNGNRKTIDSQKMIIR